MQLLGKTTSCLYYVVHHGSYHLLNLFECLTHILNVPSVTFTPAAFQHHPSLSLRDYKCRKDDDRCDGDDIYHCERFNPLPPTTRWRYKTHIFGLSNYDANTDNTYARYNDIPQNIPSVLHTLCTITNKDIRMSMADPYMNSLRENPNKFIFIIKIDLHLMI